MLYKSESPCIPNRHKPRHQYNVSAHTGDSFCGLLCCHVSAGKPVRGLPIHTREYNYNYGSVFTCSTCTLRSQPPPCFRGLCPPRQPTNRNFYLQVVIENKSMQRHHEVHVRLLQQRRTRQAMGEHRTWHYGREESVWSLVSRLRAWCTAWATGMPEGTAR